MEAKWILLPKLFIHVYIQFYELCNFPLHRREVQTRRKVGWSSMVAPAKLLTVLAQGCRLSSTPCVSQGWRNVLRS